MRIASRALCGSFLAAVAAFCGATAVMAAPLPPGPAARLVDTQPTLVGDRWYPDDDYYHPPEYYLPPPPPPARIDPGAPPLVSGYEPPVYGWLAPPRPASCGKYRYWNGEYCADARRDPPYIGPRW